MLIRLGQLGVVEGGCELKVYSRAALKRLFARIVKDEMFVCSVLGVTTLTKWPERSRLWVRVLVLLPLVLLLHEPRWEDRHSSTCRTVLSDSGVSGPVSSWCGFVSKRLEAAAFLFKAQQSPPPRFIR